MLVVKHKYKNLLDLEKTKNKSNKIEIKEKNCSNHVKEEIVIDSSQENDKIKAENHRPNEIDQYDIEYK